jgi:uncharacterized protein (TIGR02001 family)
MHKSIVAAALAASLSCAGIARAGEESNAFSANLAIVSDYDCRGVSQTDEKPALQGGFDFNHRSGLYAGVWGSSISWTRDVESDAHAHNRAELDLYIGYRHAFGDFGVDAGVLRYVYPGSFDGAWRSETGLKHPDTTEGYLGVSWKFLSFKYSHAFTRLLGAPGSRGSHYYDLSASHEVSDKLTVTAHYGIQRVTGPGESYADWKVGAVYQLGGFDLGLHYVGTDLGHAKELNAEGRVILSIGKVF